MRIHILYLIFLCLAFFARGQEFPAPIKMSALARQFSQTQNTATFAAPYVIEDLNGKNYLNAFIKVNADLQEQQLLDLGVLIGTKAGNIWTVKIPENKYDSFLAIPKGIEQIQLDQPVFTNLEKALLKTRVDSVHQGINLPQPYTGKDVVVGILDVGFDYTHPTFSDTSGNAYRIARVWEQKTSGTPPSGYSYGHEMTDPDVIREKQTDNPNQSHGSHVAGIAAGSGYGGNGSKYRGVAFESELVLVGITPAQEQWTNTGMTDIVDGLNYIFDYAASVGKPAVANLSWGCSIGPHDGSSLFSQAVNNLTGPGRIFTISAGNNGENKIHIHKSFSETDSLVGSLVGFSNNLAEKKTWLDIWGDSEAFEVQLRLYGGAAITDSTVFMPLNGSTIDTFLIGDDNDTFFFKMTGVTADLNGKPHAFLDLYSKTVNDVAVSVKAKGGEINMWTGYVLESTGYYGLFYTNGHPWASPGDTDMTIGEMGCTESAITVAAYASKTGFTNLSGSNLSYSNYVGTDKICPFSSHGPTSVGNYIKPDVAAPGLTLASAVNSADTKYAPGGPNYTLSVFKYTDPENAKDYYFAESSGTSMSAPMTAGIIALMLEADPQATPEELKALMAETAIKDTWTTSNPDPNIWGVGKINAYGMFQNFFYSSLQESFKNRISVYPNPVTDHLLIEGATDGLINIYTLMGKRVASASNRGTGISLVHLDSGFYIVQIMSRDNKLLYQQKIIKF